MRTIRELKKIFIGELIAIALILPYAAMINGDWNLSLIEFIRIYVMDIDNARDILQLTGFVLVITYSVYNLYRGIERDVFEIREFLATRKKIN